MQRWDIFCKVVDNYGDIGVCWRLARQLAHEHGLAVRLWVNELAKAQQLIEGLETSLERQAMDGVEICHWAEPFADEMVADVVIEAFGCELPQNYLAAMAVFPLIPPLSPAPSKRWRGSKACLAESGISLR